MNHPVLDALPGPARAAVNGMWNRLSEDQRRDLERWLPLSGGMSGVRDIVKFITDNYRSALVQSASTIAIVGPANVGKSTLYNQLIASSEAKAAVSPVPGTTRVAQSGSAGLFEVVDTPGADRGRRSGRNRATNRLRCSAGCRLPHHHVRCSKRRQRSGSRAIRRADRSRQTPSRRVEQDGPRAQG